MDKFRTVKSQTGRKERGQALVEYALILAFVVLALIAILAATGPAVGNVFSNVIFNLIGRDPSSVQSLADQGGAAEQFWLTVTWVANLDCSNSRCETPYPTPITLPTDADPTQFLTRTPSDTPEPSNTPTHTDTPDPTDTPTATASSTAGPSPTPEDKEFLVPFVDRADDVLDWRLDRSYVLNPGDWNVSYYNGAGCTGTPVLSTTTNWVNADWGTGSPDGAVGPDNFTACWSQNFTMAQNLPLEFLAENLVGGSMVVTLDGSTTVLTANSTGDRSSFEVPAGSHSITVTYTHTTGVAAAALLVQRTSQNPSDTVATGGDGCPWATANDGIAPSSYTGSPVNVFYPDALPANAVSWPAGQRCYLELRGWINSGGAPNPRLSFWDVWDFASAAGVEARLEIANYVETSPGVLDRSVWNNPLYTANLRSPGTANYNWTRTQIDLSSIVGLGNRWTFRFVLANTSGSAQTLRWYIDDIQVLSDPTPSKTFTVNNQWDLNSRAQMADFIFNADANYTLEQTEGAPPANEWRWNIASDFARSGTAFVLKDFAPSAATSGGAGSERVYSLEFRYPIDFSSAPASDFDGDTGDPILTFWYLPQLSGGATFTVQYNDANASGPWVDIVGGSPVPAPPYTAMFQRTIPLSSIPVQPFRLRFAVTIPQGASVGSSGLFIDDIKIERDLDSPFAPYPFPSSDGAESAENEADSARYWTGTGAWARTSQTGGVKGGAFNYTDSPGVGVNYNPGTATYLEMRRMIDLRGDTAGAPSHPAAVKPTLTFWMHYDLQGTFDVQVWTELTDWATVWTMDNADRRTNTAWERVEIDLSAWANNSNPGIDNEDDIKIRFRLNGIGAVGYDGVYVDHIRIADYSELQYVLSDSGTPYEDTIETSPTAWSFDQRWHLGGQWRTDAGQGYLDTMAISDSPGFTHDENWLSIAEMAPVFNLNGNLSDNYPALEFRLRYHIASLDQFRVQIAQEQVGETGLQTYNDMLGWGPWTDVPLSFAGGATFVSGRVDTLINGRVDLAPYVGRRIRIRFVLETVKDQTPSNGVTLDNVSLKYHNTVLTPAQFDWKEPSNWIYEGSWGSTTQYFTPGDVGAALGGSWNGIFYDCESLYPTGDCNLLGQYTTMMSEHTENPATFCPGSATADIVCEPALRTELNLWIGDGEVPYNNTTAFDSDFENTFGARWQRTVTFAPNTSYTFYAISNEGMRLRIDNSAGITGIPASNLIIDVWYNHSNQLDVATIQTDNSFPANRTLTVEYYDRGGTGVMSLSIATSRFSYSDSPNRDIGGGGYTVEPAVRWGNSSLMFSKLLSIGSGNRLHYSVMWDLVESNNTIYVEYSTDGGFTWMLGEALPDDLPYDTHPPNGTWQNRSVALPASNSLTFRFRLDTTAQGDNLNRDGMWVADITIGP